MVSSFCDLIHPTAYVRNHRADRAAANQMAQQVAQMNPGANTQMFQPGQDPDKSFQSEAENLEVIEHEYILDGVEDRLLARWQRK